MRFEEFKNKIIYRPLIFTKDLEVFISKSEIQSLHNQFKRWQKKGLIQKIKNGVYILNESDRKVTPSKTYIANQIYLPSYISLEYALSYYNLIPEGVIDITSVTTKKTVSFTNPIGVFVYQHIKIDAFKGYKSITDEFSLNVIMAEPEKAIVDFLYLNLRSFKELIKENEIINIFEYSYRFQNTEILNNNKIIEYSRLFNNNKLSKIVNIFCEYTNTERKK